MRNLPPKYPSLDTVAYSDRKELDIKLLRKRKKQSRLLVDHQLLTFKYEKPLWYAIPRSTFTFSHRRASSCAKERRIIFENDPCRERKHFRARSSAQLGARSQSSHTSPNNWNISTRSLPFSTRLRGVASALVTQTLDVPCAFVHLQIDKITARKNRS